MRKVNSFLIIVLIAMIGFAFYPLDNAENTKIDDPSYEVAKHKFWDEYQVYKTKLDNGIRTNPPVDPTGNFRVDENGNFAMNNGQNNQDRVITPTISSDVLTTYTFSQSTTTYVAINTTGTLAPGSTNCDDSGLGPFPIGFSFNYNGTVQTQFGVCCNGSMQFGAVAPVIGYTPLQSYANVIAPGAYDMQLAADGGIYYQTTGVAPNRICTIEWYHQGFWPSTGNELSYQVKLFETTGAVQIIYQTGTHTSTNGLEVGMTGVSSADFVNRTTTTNWSATTAGGANSATCTFSPTVFPPAGLTFQYLPPQPPATPTLIRPLNHSIDRYQVDTLQWSPSSGATNYHLQLATDSLFTSIAYSDTTLTVTGVGIGSFPPLSTWWWRVRAKNAVGWSAFTIPFTFKVMGAATTPTLLLPANNSVNQPVTITCKWSHSVDQTSRPIVHLHIIQPGQRDNETAVSNYWYELYSDTTIAPVVRDSTLTDTTRTVTGLTNNQNYWWRAKAKNNVGWGAFSPYFKFTTIVALPPPPTLIAPANNATFVSLTPLLDWSAVPTATSYRVQLSSDSSFATTQLDSVINVDSLRVPAGRLALNVTYYWHVYSTNAAGNSVYSPKFNFTTGLVGIIQYSNGVPKVFALHNNYPNPFNPSSTIKFDIPKGAFVKLTIYNMLGQEVQTLVNSNYEAGFYSIVWDASNEPSGVYFYKVTAGNFTDIKKMVLLK